MRQWNGLPTMGELSIIYMTINKSKCEMPTIKELCPRLTTPCIMEKKKRKRDVLEPART